MASKGEKREREEPTDNPDQPAADEPAKEDEASAKPSSDAEQKQGDGEAEHSHEHVVESGRMYFFYKPRVGVEHVEKLDDVQRFHIIMEPLEPKGKPRLIPLPKKRLPDPARHERFFAFVDAVADSVKELTEGLESSEYDTKTRGHRTQGAARAVGEAAYTIAKTPKGTRLAYKLEVPEEPMEAQKVFKIQKQASFVISIKNPENKSANPGIPQMEGEFSEPQLKRFKGRAWIPVDDRDLLDVKGAMLLLIGARDDPKADLPEDALESLEEVYVSDQEDIEEKAGKDQDKRKEVAAEKLKEAIEPGKDEPLPVAPAVTGELV